ncbi:MAG: hypothetical protein GF307_10890 [candidate division Zixibacteria bacterium]|nr:hypothetical protein [candidate division Zixibacteria bacterium]
MKDSTKSKLRVKVIANPSAGAGTSHEQIPVIRKKIEELFNDVEFSLTNGPGDAVRLARDAVSNNFHRVIVVGGDGTVSEAVQGLARTGIVLGIIPFGKNNDFYRTITNDLSLDKALRIISQGEVVKIDTGIAGKRAFVNSVNLGVQAQALEILADNNDSSLSRNEFVLNYKAVKNRKQLEYILKIDSVQIKEKLDIITINIGKYSPRGLVFTPFADNSDGLFDVCIVKRRRKLRLYLDLLRARSGLRPRNTRIRMYRCRQVSIDSDSDVPLYIDGDKSVLIGTNKSIKIIPQSLKILKEPAKAVKQDK